MSGDEITCKHCGQIIYWSASLNDVENGEWVHFERKCRHSSSLAKPEPHVVKAIEHEMAILRSNPRYGLQAKKPRPHGR
jgi:hypothetical protein